MTRRSTHHGVHTLACYAERFKVDPTTGCWLWARESQTGRPPCINLPALGRVVGLGTAVCVLTTGKAPPPGVVWHVTCRTPNCGNPAHRAAGNRSSQMLAAKVTKSAVSRARIALSKRTLSEADYAAIVESTETLEVLAQRYGIHPSHAGLIRSGKRCHGVQLLDAFRPVLKPRKVRRRRKGARR